MKYFKYRFLLSAGLLAAICLFTACHDDNLLSSESGQPLPGNKAESGFPWEPGMAFIKLKAGNDITTRAATQSVMRAKVFEDTNVKVEQVFDMTTEYADLKRQRGMDRWFFVKFDKDKSVEEVLEQLRRDPAIEKAHGNIAIVPAKATYTPVTRAPIDWQRLYEVNDGTGYNNFNDHFLKYQWHYMTTKSMYGWFKQEADINLFPAWQKETGDPNVVVAVMDSGIDFEHEDLAASAWDGKDPKTGKTIHGRNFWAVQSGQGDPDVIIPGGHGTHVAGTIAARNNNGLGVCGVAGGNGTENSGVRLMSCEIYGHDGTNETASPANIAKAFEFAAENGALVCNCSWGYAFDRTKHLNNETFQRMFKEQFEVLKVGIDYFTDIAGCDSKGNKKAGSYMKGGLVFFASGNDSQYDIDMIPASYDKVVAVGATNSMGIPTDYMNKGTWVDILAPGGTTNEGEVTRGILSTVPKDFVNQKTGPYPNTDFTHPYNSNYAYAQGTSMATPHVTGIAALVISKFGKKNPNFTNEDLRRRILSAVKEQSPYDVKPDANLAGKLGAGFIDADFALAEPETNAPDAPSIEVIDYSNDATKGYYDARITWKVTADADAINTQKTAFAYDIRLYKKVDMAQPVQTFTRYSYAKAAGAQLEQEFTGLDTDVDYVVKMVARDRSGNHSAEVSKAFRTRLNHAPAFTNGIGDKLRLLDTQSYYHKVLNVKDEDNHTWTYTTTPLPRGVELKRVGNDFDLLIKVIIPGAFEFDITLTDQLGGHTVQHFAYEVVAHTAPVANTLGDVSLFEQGQPVSVDLANAFTAMEGHALTYTAKSDNEQAVKVSVEGSQLKLTPGTRGNATVSITAVDGGKQATTTFRVRVTEQNAADVHAVYPIPAHSYIKALMRSNVKEVHATVTSVRGERLIQATLTPDARSHEVTLGIDRLAPGTYYLLLKTERLTSKHTFIKK